MLVGRQVGMDHLLMGHLRTDSTLSRAVFKSDLVKQYKVGIISGNLRVNTQNLARRVKTHGFWSRPSALHFPDLFCGIK